MRRQKREIASPSREIGIPRLFADCTDASRHPALAMASRIASLPPGFRALVTGSSGAIGGATCQRLLDAGARVFGLDARHQESGDLLHVYIDAKVFP